jgi:HK97 family phage portal protein
MELEIIQGTTARSILSPVIVNTYSGLQIPAFWRAMEFLANNLASFPISVQLDGKTVPHALNAFFSLQANRLQSAYTLWKTWFFHGEHTGNGFAYIRRPDPTSQEVIGIHTLLTEETVPYRLIPQGGTIWDASIWYWHGPSKLAIPAADVLHYKSQISYDGFVGYSPIQVFAMTLRRALQLEVYAVKWLEKGSFVRGSIELPQGTTREQADEIISTIQNYRASTGDRDVMVLSGGATLKNNTVSPVDSQLIQQGEEVTKKIAQITGVPPQFLFEGAQSKYNQASIEAAGEDVVRFCFRPRIQAIENELGDKLLTAAEQAQGYTIHMETDALLRGDQLQQMQIAKQGVGGGVLSRNEGRQAIGRPPVADKRADELLIPTHLASPQKAETA